MDRDGDLDLYLADVGLFKPDANPQDRLLINDGGGRFTDETADRIPVEAESTMSAAFLDADLDGDPDLVTGTLGDITGATADAPYRLFENDGHGRFSRVDTALPSTATGNGFDIEPADIDGDGRMDLFLASRGGTDRVLLGAREPGIGATPRSG